MWFTLSPLKGRFLCDSDRTISVTSLRYWKKKTKKTTKKKHEIFLRRRLVEQFVLNTLLLPSLFVKLPCSNFTKSYFYLLGGHCESNIKPSQ